MGPWRAWIFLLGRDGVASNFGARSEARARGEKLVVAFCAGRERPGARLAGEARKNSAEARAADATPSPGAALLASRGSNVGVADLGDGDVGTAPSRAEPTAGHRARAERLGKLLRDAEARARATRMRELGLLGQRGEPRRSLARSEAGQSEYQKNAIARYAKNVAEQDSLLPVVATVLGPSDARAKQTRERRNASRSFFSASFS